MRLLFLDYWKTSFDWLPQSLLPVYWLVVYWSEKMASISKIWPGNVWIQFQFCDIFCGFVDNFSCGKAFCVIEGYIFSFRSVTLHTAEDCKVMFTVWNALTVRGHWKYRKISKILLKAYRNSSSLMGVLFSIYFSEIYQPHLSLFVFSN